MIIHLYLHLIQVKHNTKIKENNYWSLQMFYPDPMAHLETFKISNVELLMLFDTKNGFVQTEPEN